MVLDFQMVRFLMFQIRLSRTCDQTSFDGVKLVLDAAKDAGVKDLLCKKFLGCFGCYAYNLGCPPSQ